MTNEIKIYVVNLGKYNEGESVGQWFTLPVDLDEIKEAIGVEDGSEYEEYAIHDYEAPFEIGEGHDIEALNETAERMEDMEEDDIEAVGKIMENDSSIEFDEACNMLEDGDARLWYEDSMADIAYTWHDETGTDMDAPLMEYVDWERVGRDMEMEGTFLEVRSGLWVEVIG